MSLDDHSKARFKIDVNPASVYPFRLYMKQYCWHYRITGLTEWKEIMPFTSKEALMNHYEQIKNLPEYLE